MQMEHGKHAGKTFNEIYRTESKYLHWLEGAIAAATFVIVT